MAEILVPGVTWQESPGSGTQYLMPGETWIDEPPAPTPPATVSGNFLLLFT